MEEFESTFGCHLTDDVDEANDPAAMDPGLSEKLANNQKLASKRLDEVSLILRTF
jgi:hypothetical protein